MRLQALATTQVVDLGTLPGGTAAAALAINNAGLIVGTSDDLSSRALPRQVVWRAGVPTAISEPMTAVLQTLDTPFTQAVNDSGEVASFLPTAAPNGSRITTGMYWNANFTPFALPALPGGEGTVFAHDINSSGLIAGSSQDARRVDGHALLWSKTTLSRDLGQMGAGNVLLGNQTSARGLNDAGDVVGRALLGSEFHAFLWRSGVFTDLGPGAAVDINDAGVVVGNTNPEVYAAWIWRDGVRSLLPPLPGRPGNYLVNDLNNLGDAVGSGPRAPDGTGSFGGSVAVLWRGGQVYELGHYPGGNSSAALGINDQGQIVGVGNVVPGGPMRALVWKGWEVNVLPTVTLAATSSTSIRAGGKVSFKVTITDPDYGPWAYTMNDGTGTSSGTRNSTGSFSLSRQYKTRGTYAVSVTVKDARGGIGKSQVVTVTVR